MWIVPLALVLAPVAEFQDNVFAAEVAPFVARHCLECHGAEDPEAELSLAGNMLKWKPWEGTAATVDMALTRKTPMPVCRAAWAALTRGTLF